MRFTIPADHPSLPGHFPGHPVVPGVVLLDRVLQAIEHQHGPLAAVQLPQVKFLQPLMPGQMAEVLLEGTAPRWRFRVLHDGQVLVRGDISLAVDVDPA